MVENNRVPNPGSDEAIKQGCRCPVIDNGHGTGYYTTDNGVPVFVINETCPLHGVKRRKKNVRLPR